MSSSPLLQNLRHTAIRYLRHGGLPWDEAYLRAQKTKGSWCFIHINKCGGTSVEHALNIPKIHDTARQRRDRIGAARWDEMTSFSIVRHPYARARSLYKYRNKTGQTGMAESPISLNDWIRAAFAEKDPAYHDKPQMFLPARDWLTDENDRIIVDFVARLEDIDTDWQKIQDLIGVSAALPKENATAPDKGVADGLTPESRAILEAYFATDFTTFGYDR